jgi:hypothetical protein
MTERKIRPVFAADYVPATTRDHAGRVEEALTAAEFSWQQVLQSGAQLLDAERRFRHIRSTYIKVHGRSTDTENRISSDSDFKTAVSDCAYFSQRLLTFAGAYEAATTRLVKLREDVRRQS